MTHVPSRDVAAPAQTDAAGPNRRDFMKQSALAGVALASAASITSVAHAQTLETVRLGLIGCGGRGTGATINSVQGSAGVELVAMADLFDDRVNGSRASLKDQLGEAFKVTDADVYTGFDAYKQLLSRDDVDMVILATPPGFRPYHFEAAINAGKHVFMEKPVAVDPVGIRKVVEMSRKAKEKGLGVVAGTQRRHELPYVEGMKAIQDGIIGDVISANVYWQQGGLWYKSLQEAKDKNWSQTEWQLRNWLYFTWLSGDHVVEQHVHNIDVALWAMGDQAPQEIYGNGGRIERTSPDFGHIFDHHSAEIRMPGGQILNSDCRQINGCDNRVSERIIGTKGYAECGGNFRIYNWDGKGLKNFRGGVNPYQQEHTDLVASIRAGEPLNEGERIAQSCLTAICVREASYSGKIINFNWAMNESKLDTMPKDLSLGDMSVPPVAIPGKYQMV